MDKILEDFIDTLNSQETISDTSSADYSREPDDYPIMIGIIASRPRPKYTPEYVISSFERLLNKFFQEDEHSAICFYYNKTGQLIFSDRIERELSGPAKSIKDYDSDIICYAGIKNGLRTPKRLFMLFSAMSELLKGCQETNIYFQNKTTSDTFSKEYIPIIEDLSNERSRATTLQLMAYNEFMSAAYILLDRKDIYYAVTDFLHGFSRKNEVIIVSRSEVSFLIKNKMRDNALPLIDMTQTEYELQKYIQNNKNGFSLDSIQENLPNESYYTISELSVAQNICEKYSKQSFQEFKNSHERLIAEDSLASVWLSTSEIHHKKYTFVTASFYTGLVMKSDGIPCHQAVAITIPGTIADLRYVIETAAAVSEKKITPELKVLNENLIHSGYITEDTFTPDDLKMLNEDFIDNLESDDVPTETIIVKEPKSPDEYDYAVGIAFDDSVYDMKNVKERLKRFLEKTTFLTDYSEPFVDSVTYPNGKYNWQSGVFEDEPVQFCMDTDFKSIKQIALFFLSIYGLFNKSRGRMRISVLDFENGGEIRMTKLLRLTKLIQTQASNQSISDPTDYFQAYNQLAIAAEFFLGNTNVYVGMKRLFPNYDASWVFKNLAVSKVADDELHAARKDTFEEQIHCSIYRDELFEFLRPYKNDKDYRVYQIYSPYDDSSEIEFEQRQYIFKKYLAKNSDTTFVKAVDFNLWVQGQLFWHALILIAEPSTDQRDTKLYHTAVAIIFDMTTTNEDPIPQIKQKFLELCKD